VSLSFQSLWWCWVVSLSFQSLWWCWVVSLSFQSLWWCWVVSLSFQSLWWCWVVSLRFQSLWWCWVVSTIARVLQVACAGSWTRLLSCDLEEGMDCALENHKSLAIFHLKGIYLIEAQIFSSLIGMESCEIRWRSGCGTCKEIPAESRSLVWVTVKRGIIWKSITIHKFCAVSLKIER